MIWVFLVFSGVMTLAAFIAFGLDKYKAKTNRWRIPERTLFLLAFAGGGTGAFLGMRAFHHKTLHKQFSVGIPLIMIAQWIFAGWFLWRMNM